MGFLCQVILSAWRQVSKVKSVLRLTCRKERRPPRAGGGGHFLSSDAGFQVSRVASGDCRCSILMDQMESDLN